MSHAAATAIVQLRRNPTQGAYGVRAVEFLPQRRTTVISAAAASRPTASMSHAAANAGVQAPSESDSVECVSVRLVRISSATPDDRHLGRGFGARQPPCPAPPRPPEYRLPRNPTQDAMAYATPDDRHSQSRSISHTRRTLPTKSKRRPQGPPLTCKFCRSLTLPRAWRRRDSNPSATIPPWACYR